jgi:hypothetical protein
MNPARQVQEQRDGLAHSCYTNLVTGQIHCLQLCRMDALCVKQAFKMPQITDTEAQFEQYNTTL